jgi:ribonuclease D
MDTPVLLPYAGISLADVRLVTSRQTGAEARRALLDTDAIGFDTESKPTFAKGETSTGPHLIQLATDSHAYLFCVGQMDNSDDLREILEARHVLKVGFDIRTDIQRIEAKLGIATANVLDLALSLQDKDHRKTVGAKGAAARFLGSALQKSKKTTTSNWANPRLTERQILYAANDAQVSLRIYRAWLEARSAQR